MRTATGTRLDEAATQYGEIVTKGSAASCRSHSEPHCQRSGEHVARGPNCHRSSASPAAAALAIMHGNGCPSQVGSPRVTTDRNEMPTWACQRPKSSFHRRNLTCPP